MTIDRNKLEEFVSSAIAGSLIGQIVAHRQIPLDEATESASLERLAYEIRDFGINPHILSEHAISALIVLLMDEPNADRVVTCLTDLLWSILGDPKGGGAPPEIYRKAALAMHLFFIGVLDPATVKGGFPRG